MGPENRTKPLEPGKMPGTETLSLITICADEDFAGRLRRFVAVGDVALIQAELQHYLSGESDAALISTPDL